MTFWFWAHKETPLYSRAGLEPGCPAPPLSIFSICEMGLVRDSTPRATVKIKWVNTGKVLKVVADTVSVSCHYRECSGSGRGKMWIWHFQALLMPSLLLGFTPFEMENRAEASGFHEFIFYRVLFLWMSTIGVMEWANRRTFTGMSRSHSLWFLTTSSQHWSWVCQGPRFFFWFPSSTDKSTVSGNLSFGVNLVGPPLKKLLEPKSQESVTGCRFCSCYSLRGSPQSKIKR